MADMKGYGRNAPIDWDEVDSSPHRSRHHSAIRQLARQHDDERRVERELEELDRSIIGWSDALGRQRRRSEGQRRRREGLSRSRQKP